MLGYPLAAGTANDLYGTPESGKDFILSKLDCTGNEASVFDCLHPGELNTDCLPTEVVGVQCATSKYAMNNF